MSPHITDQNAPKGSSIQIFTDSESAFYLWNLIVNQVRSIAMTRAAKTEYFKFII